MLKEALFLQRIWDIPTDLQVHRDKTYKTVLDSLSPTAEMKPNKYETLYTMVLKAKTV